MQISNSQNTFNIRPELWICLFLILSTLLIYFQVSTFEFVNFDLNLLLDLEAHN
jgi:hypothetical protein